jgi:ribose 5-phosphate isomerase A
VRYEGLRIKDVPTSLRTAQLTRQVGIEVITLEDAGTLIACLVCPDSCSHAI